LPTNIIFALLATKAHDFWLDSDTSISFKTHKMAQKPILLLGSGELGKELVIALKRLGENVIACDNYANAPAMQVADGFEVFNMLNADALDAAVAKHQPKLIVPEVESIRTGRFYTYEQQGYTVVPSAKAANFTMNRKLIRDLAAKELGLRTAPYVYATTAEGFTAGVRKIGMPCVVKPLMSSSGKGQSVIKTEADVTKAWEYALAGSRGDLQEVIIEGFVNFDSEITLLTVTQHNGETLFCPPIGHRQESGDYQESWQPTRISDVQLKEAQDMARKVTKALGGAGIWGIEFFLAADGVYFSELSPRPHDTGMVTLAGTQLFNEFELHARAILNYPIPSVELVKPGASAVLLAKKASSEAATFAGIEQVLKEPNTDIRIFGKPSMRVNRRMGVVLLHGAATEHAEDIARQAATLAERISME
jgi:phosphoribosylglycinamide formyltransferase 2